MILEKNTVSKRKNYKIVTNEWALKTTCYVLYSFFINFFWCKDFRFSWLTCNKYLFRKAHSFAYFDISISLLILTVVLSIEYCAHKGAGKHSKISQEDIFRENSCNVYGVYNFRWRWIQFIVTNFQHFWLIKLVLKKAIYK